MHKLSRQVRFSINPFLDSDSIGFNSYCSKPAGEGLAVFFQLDVELTGKVDASTGFVVNVTDIDLAVRKNVVPVFAQSFREFFRKGKSVGFNEIAALLKKSTEILANKFGKADVSKLSLSLNPYRKASIDREVTDMMYLSEKFEVAATHKLWNDEFSEEKNLAVFGKCANKSGHGHNYIIEVTVEAMPADINITEYEKTIDEKLIRIIDHKNLNADVEFFSKNIPTVENIASFAWQKLDGQFKNSRLHCITVWETDKTSCSYYGK